MGSPQVVTKHINDDAIALLVNDHREIESMIDSIENEFDTPEERREALDELLEEVGRNVAVEELILYPAIARAAGEDAVDAALERTSSIRELLAAIEGTSENGGDNTLLTTLIEEVRDHFEDEESTLFAIVTELLAEKDLDRLAVEIAVAKETVSPEVDLDRSPVQRLRDAIARRSQTTTGD
ncbi:MAG: hemerythrin domain-containing protein [Actinomycetota bacterium]|nr:hemerythrin domain-containing protein [Actinomycetota bacterium]